MSEEIINTTTKGNKEKKMESRSLNFYQRILAARKELSNSGLNKSGTGGRFTYFQLTDFVPCITEINNKYGILSLFDDRNICPADGSRGFACLTLQDVYDDEKKLVFTIPTEIPNIPGAPSKIQAIGALLTYVHRYLYMAAYEIAESDMVDYVTSNEVSRAELIKKLIPMGITVETLIKKYAPGGVLEDVPTEKIIHAYEIMKEREKEKEKK